MLIFDVHANFLFSQCKPVPGAYLGKNVTKCHTSNTQKMTENGSIVFIASVQLNNQNQKYMEPKIEVYKKAYLTQWGWSKCLCPHQAIDQ